FTAFADFPAQFILSAGKQTDLISLQAPANFIVRNFVPQLAILDRVSAFVTHGGMNSVHESLNAGVPMILVPQQIEQLMVAKQVIEIGAGVGTQMTPPLGTPSISQLQSSLQGVLKNPQMPLQAKQVGDSLRSAGGVDEAVQVIKTFAQKHVR
ncbi:MAG: nucleotide disphospho-sugar-binding domain-containing protein, partial [Chloroflexota bacterium]